MTDPVNVFATIIFCVAWFAWYLYRREHPRHFGELVGSMNGIEVTVAEGDGGRGMVGLTFPGGSDSMEIRAVVSARDARRLAELIRIGATPGATLGIARVNYRRGKGPAVSAGPFPD